MQVPLEGSTEALVYLHSVTFPNDDGAPSPASLTAVPGDSGETSANYLLGGPPNGTTLIAGAPIAAIPLAVLVPEPSTFLLGAIGGLVLLRRKR